MGKKSKKELIKSNQTHKKLSKYKWNGIADTPKKKEAGNVNIFLKKSVVSLKH